MRRYLQITLSAAYSLVLLAGVGGCLSVSNGKPPGPWHEAYETINDADSQTFVSNALAKAVAEFGDPVIPVNKVMLRRSRKTGDARRYRIGEDFSLTECIDETSGVFVIYIGVYPDDENYYGLLGHECLHLLNPHIIDWYMEGIATLFSEEVCADMGLGWGDWKRHFMRSRREPYAVSYRMMMALKEACPVEYPSLVLHTATNGKGPEWFRIDIDAWLDTLPPNKRAAAVDIIDEHCDLLRHKVSSQYYFTVPAALR